MNKKTERIELKFIAAPRSASFGAFWTLYSYGIAVAGILAGLASFSVWLAVPVAALIAWMVPEFWPMRLKPKAVFKDRFDIPRGMFLSSLGFVFLMALVGFGLFHTVGANALWYISGGSRGLHPHDVLSVAIFWSGLWLLTRLLRRVIKHKNEAYLVEADRRSRDLAAEFTSALRPEMIEACANRRVI